MPRSSTDCSGGCRVRGQRGAFDDRERDWSAEVLSTVFGDHQVPTSPVVDQAPSPVNGPPQPGGHLAASFDRAGAIHRLEQEIELQRNEVGRLTGRGSESDDLARKQAELDARELARDELVLGRDPRGALRSRSSELAAEHGPADPRVRAYVDTVNYFTASGAFAEVSAGAGRVPDFVDTSRLLSEWRQRLGGLQARGEQLRPRSDAKLERAEAFEDVGSFMQQAIVDTSARRDPRQS